MTEVSLSCCNPYVFNVNYPTRTLDLQRLDGIFNSPVAAFAE
jgi:hypothetical protein